MGLKVLIVEDDELLLSLMKLKLEQSGFATVAATDGAAALEVLSKENPDVVITELMLPKVDGFQLLREMHKRNGQLSTRVIVTSFRNGSADRLQALKLGALDFIPKPFSLDELTARVTLVCQTKEMP